MALIGVSHLTNSEEIRAKQVKYKLKVNLTTLKECLGLSLLLNPVGRCSVP